jgi:hypothetical protein
MASAKLAATCGLAVLALSACGSASQPAAGPVGAAGAVRSRGVIDDPRASHLGCLRAHHLPVREVGSTGLQIGLPPSGPTVAFAPTPGAAQALQIDGLVPGGEVIGGAVLYPHAAPDDELRQVEDCLAQGVKG